MYKTMEQLQEEKRLSDEAYEKDLDRNFESRLSSMIDYCCQQIMSYSKLESSLVYKIKGNPKREAVFEKHKNLVQEAGWDIIEMDNKYYVIKAKSEVIA